MSIRLKSIEEKTISILRESFFAHENGLVLWSMGKDSTVLLWCLKKAFFNRFPFPVLHVDTGRKMKEMYDFRDRMSFLWDIPLCVEMCPPMSFIKEDLPYATKSSMRKSVALKKFISKHNILSVFSSIRRDEEGLRSKESFFSARGINSAMDSRQKHFEINSVYDHYRRGDGSHVRVHPLLHWTEVDIWEYIQQENIPVVDLYFSKKGFRYRSLGDFDITKPVSSNAKNLKEVIEELKQTKSSERSGRLVDSESEHSFEFLRDRGYF